MSLDKEAARGEYAREQSVFPDIPPWAAGLVGIIIGVMTLPVWIALMAKLPEGEDLAKAGMGILIAASVLVSVGGVFKMRAGFLRQSILKTCEISKGRDHGDK